uniref:Pseudouridine synthase RsuA/RluA-like domain-containing protein n=1 Tax=Chromera velia CCMP2878 TaxID=1169474 RepID=A0A0G4G151_9ALVE|eukprot:Cvel_4046.t1-p1 / transcript=Cvel_4046.t1 / gene=Cvel_4046 / organism=Chromera_velia_CCMP2878 / gene_product=hypothetical protein / transcript_product=hypothetical protein / location=Cvel_scaffold172:35165-42849(+) / protein_length=1388 / sequence_SO=supercontig / SO=protein_coding / is_pseudo=false
METFERLLGTKFADRLENLPVANWASLLWAIAKLECNLRDPLWRRLVRAVLGICSSRRSWQQTGEKAIEKAKEDREEGREKGWEDANTQHAVNLLWAIAKFRLWTDRDEDMRRDANAAFRVLLGEFLNRAAENLNGSFQNSEEKDDEAQGESGTKERSSRRVNAQDVSTTLWALSALPVGAPRSGVEALLKGSYWCRGERLSGRSVLLKSVERAAPSMSPQGLSLALLWVVRETAGEGGERGRAVRAVGVEMRRAAESAVRGGKRLGGHETASMMVAIVKDLSFTLWGLGKLCASGSLNSSQLLHPSFLPTTLHLISLLPDSEVRHGGSLEIGKDTERRKAGWRGTTSWEQMSPQHITNVVWGLSRIGSSSGSSVWVSGASMVPVSVEPRSECSSASISDFAPGELPASEEAEGALQVKKGIFGRRGESGVVSETSLGVNRIAEENEELIASSHPPTSSGGVVAGLIEVERQWSRILFALRGHLLACLSHQIDAEDVGEDMQRLSSLETKIEKERETDDSDSPCAEIVDIPEDVVAEETDAQNDSKFLSGSPLTAQHVAILLWSLATIQKVLASLTIVRRAREASARSDSEIRSLSSGGVATTGWKSSFEILFTSLFSLLRGPVCRRTLKSVDLTNILWSAAMSSWVTDVEMILAVLRQTGVTSPESLASVPPHQIPTALWALSVLRQRVMAAERGGTAGVICESPVSPEYPLQELLDFGKGGSEPEEEVDGAEASRDGQGTSSRCLVWEEEDEGGPQLEASEATDGDVQTEARGTLSNIEALSSDLISFFFNSLQSSSPSATPPSSSDSAINQTEMEMFEQVRSGLVVEGEGGESDETDRVFDEFGERKLAESETEIERVPDWALFGAAASLGSLGRLSGETAGRLIEEVNRRVEKKGLLDLSGLEPGEEEGEEEVGLEEGEEVQKGEWADEEESRRCEDGRGEAGETGGEILPSTRLEQPAPTVESQEGSSVGVNGTTGVNFSSSSPSVRRLHKDGEGSPSKSPSVLHTEDDFLFVLKPPGWATSPESHCQMRRGPQGRETRMGRGRKEGRRPGQRPELSDWLNDTVGWDAFGRPELASGLVHRYDLETSGPLLCARDAEAFYRLKLLLEGQRMKKVYVALVEGHLGTPGKAFRVEAPLLSIPRSEINSGGGRREGREDEKNRPGSGQMFRESPFSSSFSSRSDSHRVFVSEEAGRRALSVCEPLVHLSLKTMDESSEWNRTQDKKLTNKLPSKATLCLVRLVTGRTHQARVHLASLGHPIVFDRLYGASLLTSEPAGLRQEGEQKNGDGLERGEEQGRLCLHCLSLSIPVEAVSRPQSACNTHSGLHDSGATNPEPGAFHLKGIGQAQDEGGSLGTRRSFEGKVVSVGVRIPFDIREVVQAYDVI